MLNLIKLEMKKFKLQGYIKGAAITQFTLIAFFLLFEMILKIEKEPASEVLEASMMFIDTLGRITFVIFASVMIAKIVISEYSNKTINLMFMYPVSRKKIFGAKLIIVAVFTFINIVISNILLTMTLVIANSIFIFQDLTLLIDNIISSAPTMLLNSALAAITALIPLYFGMKKKSVSTTILSSILVVTVMYSNSGGFTLSSILPIAMVVSIIALLVGVGTLNKLDSEDVI